MLSYALLFADVAAPPKSWPDGIDWTVTLSYLALAFGLPILGYVCMVLDIRAYLRSLRRAIMVIAGYRTELPEWARKNTPRCILALGLTMPCTSDDILVAYRRKGEAAPSRPRRRSARIPAAAGPIRSKRWRSSLKRLTHR